VTPKKKEMQMKKPTLATLAILTAAATLTGCKSADLSAAARDALAYRDWQTEKKAVERAEAEAAAAEAQRKAEADAAAKKAAEQDAYNAALAPPHPAQYRDQANADGWAYTQAGEQPPIIGPDNSKLYLMLYKTPAHSLRETVVTLGRAWLPVYDAGDLASLDICADPWGRNVIQAGSIVAPYEKKHPAAYFPHLGQHYRPGPVFIVGRDKAGNRLFVYLVPDPGQRTGALR